LQATVQELLSDIVTKVNSVQNATMGALIELKACLKKGVAVGLFVTLK